MKKVKNLFMLIILVLPFLITNSSALLAHSEEADVQFQNGGNVYDDLSGNYGILGIASQFHIFAKGTTKLSAHTNGNIATNNFAGGANFGTNIHEGLVSKDINYLKNIQEISSSSGVNSTSNRSNKFVVGITNNLSLVDNGNAVTINATKMDNLKFNEVYQDSISTNYIDFDSEFSNLENASTNLSAMLATQTVTNSIFQDINNRVINISDTMGPIAINIDESVLEQATPLTINNPNNVVIIMNVINGSENQNVASQIKYNARSNHETEDFSEANISWNFGNKVSNLNINAPFQGTVLAPNATINANQNLDGSIIGTNVNINAESHRWDPNPIIPDQSVEETGSVILTKTDSEDAQKVLSGAEFELYNSDTGTLINTYTTGKSGTLTVTDLPLGNYYFVETKAPTGYELNSDKHEFKIEAGKTSAAVMVNVSNVKTKEETGSVILTKTDSEDAQKVLSGAEFELYNSDTGTLINTYTTGKFGTLTVTDLPLGNYYFVETKAPTDYELNSDKHEFKIEAGKTSTAVMVNVSNVKTKEETGSVILTKTDSEDAQKVLSGAEFELYNSDTGTLINTYTTGKSGTLTVTDLPLGNYYFVETKAPTGYELNSDKHEFKIEAGKTSTAVMVNVSNVKTKEETGSVILTKTDSEDAQKVLSGAEFELYNSDTGTLINTYTTGKSGTLTVTDLPLGNYYFVETKAPTGYELNSDKHEFKIEAGKTSTAVMVNVSNVKTKEETGSVILTKTDSEDAQKVLSGAEFELYNSDTGTLINTYTTGKSGTLTVTDLPLGNYYFVETKAPTGYELNSDKHEFKIEAGKTSTAVMVNVSNVSNVKTKKETGSVILTKTDSEDAQKVLSGAEFELYNSDTGTLINTYTTGKSGTLTVTDLPLGNYYFVEIKAPTGYELNSDKHEFKIEAGKTSTAVTVNVSNVKAKKGIYKTDDSNSKNNSFLPKTGEKVEYLVNLIGVLLMLITYISFIIYRRKDKIME